ncbi:MAG: SUMF1/EgtB/PvdO family nonheme iron enzyme [Verrucomicrobia bacterium]|nr:SUMF1/EgtB/PvdO family nonheme iron enzyme [Verrucomicrobiota bacterium]
MDLKIALDHRAQVEQFRHKYRTGLVTLLFTDIVGSTKLKQALGDRDAVALMHHHHSLVREILSQFPDGQEISTAGDSFFLVFVKPSDAVRFALLLQARLRVLAEASGPNSETPLTRPSDTLSPRGEGRGQGEGSVSNSSQVRATPAMTFAPTIQDRIGIHIGEVVIEEREGAAKPRDLYGMQVDSCARVMSLGAGNQILLTRSAFDNARQALKGEEMAGLGALSWLNHGTYQLAGVEEPVEICEVGEASLAALQQPPDSEKARRAVVGDQETVLGWRPALGQLVPNTKWVLEQKLGEGGFGEVWLGRHQTMKERRVFKFCFRADRVRSLKREMTLFRILKERVGDHPNIVRLLEVYFDEPPFYVVMDHVEGQDLKVWCEEQGGVEKVPLAARLEIVAQIADALQAAHDAGVIHRDVKPGNILVSFGVPPSGGRAVESSERKVPAQREPAEAGTTSNQTVASLPHLPVQVKLTDFGIGQIVSAEALAGVTNAGFTHTIVAESSSSQTGSQMYMAPELLAGKSASTRSDIYSLGVVLYQLLVGDMKYPLTTDWQNEIADPLLRDDLKHCVAGHPEDRFAIAGELAKNLRSLPERRAVLTQEQAVMRKREQRVQRWRLIRSAALGAAIVALTFTVMRFYLRSAKIRWAREQALPQAAQLADAEKYSEALELAIQAGRYLPKEDPALTNLLGRVSVRVSIETVPPGADVYAREYRVATTNWPHLGKTPVTGLRMPRGLYRWQIRKLGYAVVEQAFEGTSGTMTNRFTLDEESGIPPGMVRVTDGETWMQLTGLDHLELVKVGDYLIDRYEVSNRQFQDFVDAGGYLTTNHWKQPFIKGGKPLSWKEAMTLFRDQTGQPSPSTWASGKYPEAQGNYPVTGVSWYEAAAYCEFAGKSLPTIFHWNRAASIRFASSIIPLSNFGEQGTAPVGAYQGMSSVGIYDMAGNVKEWCWNESGNGKRYILGGSWLEPNYMFNVPDAQSAFERIEAYGFRCVKSPGSTPSSAAAADPIPVALRDYSMEKPVTDEIFQVYRSAFSYDKTELNATVESVDETSGDWKMQKVRFNAAYGNEQVIAYLFLPRKSAPPYQTILYFPGSGAMVQRSSEAKFLPLHTLHSINFIVQSGRAVLYPVYKSTYERGDGLKSDRPSPTTFYRDHVIAWSKDLGRAIDYLQARKDIDPEKFGYFGFSWGGTLGPVLLAVEPRIKVSVLAVGGFWMQRTLPEVDQINFAPHVTIPTLMLNGRYDFAFPVESSQLPMFRLLGTPAQDKRHLIYDTGHAMPRSDLLKETLAWLDRYLGPVK